MSKKENNNPTRMERYNRFMEIFWFVVSIGTALIGLYITFTQSFEEAAISYGLSVIAFVLSYSRKRYRRAIEKRRREEEHEG